jgi:hypothetical protein
MGIKKATIIVGIRLFMIDLLSNDGCKKDNSRLPPFLLEAELLFNSELSLI